MTIFNGKNNQSSFNSYYNRSVYNNNAYGEDQTEDPIESKDLTLGENKHYGLVDLKYNFIIPNEDTLSSHQSEGFSVDKGLPFVVDMFADLKTIMSRSDILKCTLEFDIGVNRTYESPIDDYINYISVVIEEYIQNGILETTTNLGKRIASNSITDYKSFVNSFIEYCEHSMVGKPITFTGFLASRFSSRFNSGLAIQWTQADPSVDQPKFDEIINTKAFKIFKNVLRQVGFCFDFHNPSVIIADLGSPAIIPYMKNYNISSYEELFSVYYTNTNIININILYDILLSKYNNFAYQYEYDKFITEHCSRNRVGFIQRKVEFDKNLENDIETFCILRNIEMSIPYTAKQLKNLIKKSKKIQKKFDKSTSIDYINSVFKEVLLNFSYGSKDLQRKIATLEQQKLGGLNEQTPSVSNY